MAVIRGIYGAEAEISAKLRKCRMMRGSGETISPEKNKNNLAFLPNGKIDGATYGNKTKNTVFRHGAVGVYGMVRAVYAYFARRKLADISCFSA